jgi:hypothetical protein
LTSIYNKSRKLSKLAGRFAHFSHFGTRISLIAVRAQNRMACFIREMPSHLSNHV